MNNIIDKYFLNNDIIQKIGRENIEKRWNLLYTTMESFILRNNYSHLVIINKDLLAMTIFDYYKDIISNKNIFGIHLDNDKIIAYTSYWLLKNKPIQISEKTHFNNKELLFINEKYIMQYVLAYIIEYEEYTNPILLQNEYFKQFSKKLFNCLKYKQLSKHTLANIIFLVRLYLSNLC